MEVLFRTWRDVLEDLIETWDNNEANSGLPLDSPEESDLRLMVRAYVPHYMYMSDELHRVWEKTGSEWDHSRELWTAEPATLAWRFDALDSGEFWSRFVKRLDPSSAEKLLDWAVKKTSGHKYEPLARIPFITSLPHSPLPDEIQETDVE